MTPSDTSGRAAREAHEDDPTGIRALLQDLPDPGPMPQDLVARIEARLEVERAHREQEQGRGLTARSDEVLDLAAERSHRRPGRTVALLGAAAAGLLVATVSIGELAGTGFSGGPALDSAAQVPSRAASGTGGDDADAEGAEEMAGGSGTGPEAAEGGADGDAEDDGDEGAVLLGAPPEEVVVLADLGSVRPGDYRQVILEHMDDEAARTAAGADPLSKVGAQRCWDAMGPPQPWSVLRAAPAQLDGRPVVVLLGTEGSAGEAAVLPWSCTSGEAAQPLHTTSWASSP